MVDATRRARPATRPARIAARPAWRPVKITFEEVYNLSSGGRTTRQMSLPAISMHIAMLREEGEIFTLHGGKAA